MNFWQDGQKTVGGITSWHKSSVMVHDIGNKFVIAFTDPTMDNKGYIKININQQGSLVIAKDEAIEVISLKPKIEFTAKVDNLRGKTLTIEISK